MGVGRRRAGPDHKASSSGSVTAVLSLVILVLAVTGAAVLALTQPRAPARHPSSARPAAPALPLEVEATTPGPLAGGQTPVVAPSAVLTVRLSVPLAPTSPMPSLSPPVAGQWSSTSPTSLQFVPSAPLVPGTAETLVVPAGPAGMVGAAGQELAAATSVHFAVAPGSTLRLQQLLAQLGYLPVTFAPTSPSTPAQLMATVQQGAFAWRWADQPASLTSQWVPGAYGVVTQGAVMSFESQHDLTVAATAPGPDLWAALLADAAAGAADPLPYGYVYVSTALPESATVYQDGAVAYTTVANTGVAAAPTTPGTYPVYLRYEVTTMEGTNPTGSHYVDPGIPWVSYFHGGDALHGFVRSSYGFPQSVGCVELPPANAAVVWPMTPIGTLVTVA